MHRRRDRQVRRASASGRRPHPSPARSLPGRRSVERCRSAMDEGGCYPNGPPASRFPYPAEQGDDRAGGHIPLYAGRTPGPPFNAFSTLGPLSLGGSTGPAVEAPSPVATGRPVNQRPPTSSFSLPAPSSMLDRLVLPLYPTPLRARDQSLASDGASPSVAAAALGPVPRGRPGKGQRRRIASPAASSVSGGTGSAALLPPPRRTMGRVPAPGKATNASQVPTAAASAPPAPAPVVTAFARPPVAPPLFPAGTLQGGHQGRVHAAAATRPINVVAGRSSPSDDSGTSKSVDILFTKVEEVARTVTGMAAKVGMLMDAVSGNTKQAEGLGKSLEGMGKAVVGLRSSIDKVLNSFVVPDTGGATPIGTPAEEGAVMQSDEDVDVSSGDEIAAPVASKFRRVGSGAGNVKTSPGRAAAVSQAKEQAEARVQGMHDAIAVRCVLSDVVPARIGAARTCAEVYSDVATFVDLVKTHTMDTLGLSHDAAVTWLMTHVKQPTKGNDTDARTSKKRAASDGFTTVRPIKLLKAVQPHLIGSLKKRILPIYFAALSLEISELTLITVMTWLINNDYTQSPVGKKAICECLVSLFVFLGAGDRVETVSVGSGRVIRASLGHYALVSGFVRYFLEGLKDKLYRDRALTQARQRRTGAEPGVYLYFRAELLRVHAFLDKDDLPHEGLVLTDGGVINRAELHTPENDQAAIMYNRQQILEINYPSQLATLVTEKTARDSAARAASGATV